ncbi:MAG: AraC family transcriptional regulator [Bacteroidota bacterium]
MRPQVTLREFPFFDSLTILQANAYKADFPIHSHEEISLTLVRSGYETTQANGQELLAPGGSISLTRAGVLHANPNSYGSPYDFTTYYLSPDLIQFLRPGKTLDNQVIHHPFLFEQFCRWSEEQHSTEILQQLLCTLLDDYGQLQNRTTNDHLSPELFAEVIAFIDQQLERRIMLEELARIAKLSPFHFARRFKLTKGISPLQYITLRRIDHAKKMLRSGHPITDTAYALGFFDQSHFHRFFRRYTGLTPGTFSQASKIVQDK